MLLTTVLNIAGMHVTYYTLTISCVCFGLLELAMALYSGRAMRKLMVIRILHRINQHNQEVDAEGKVMQRSASLQRLFTLAREVGTETLRLI